MCQLWYGDSAGNTVQENSSVLFPNPNALVTMQGHVGSKTLLQQYPLVPWAGSARTPRQRPRFFEMELQTELPT